MRAKDAYITHIHRYGFRAGTPARCVGVVLAGPVTQEPRPCYHVRFEDGVNDYWPIADSRFYRFGDADKRFEVTE